MKPTEVRAVLSWLGAILGVACLLCIGVAFVYGPEAIAAGDHVADLGLAVTPCPGCAFCGLSRGFALFGAGRFSEGVALNPSVVLLYPFFCLVGVAGPTYALLNLLRSSS